MVDFGDRCADFLAQCQRPGIVDSGEIHGKLTRVSGLVLEAVAVPDGMARALPI